MRRLKVPSTRGGALVALQDWAPDPAALPFRAQLRRRLDEVRARPDVQAALAEVGRVQDIPFPATYWGDL